ncbi:methyltransferase-like protein 27 [Aplysia californica]|uniref:Methyltransferase-like protein 27 n=1 Tax=Aplysia californica TaxID=6500 RepID=A0ABM1A1S4_APLCA|nr:methyltransferase-like protein 27 [Aplysia californica]
MANSCITEYKEQHVYTHEDGISSAECAKRYSEWAQAGKYEEHLSEEYYQGPIIAADTLAKLFPEPATRANVRVLDVAAGTGLVAERLKPRGFSNIDALEPSEGMLALALAKDLYVSSFTDLLGDQPTSIRTDTYDAAVISGGMGEGHIPCSGMKELLRVVKPGGYVVVVMRQQYLSIVPEYIDRLEPLMKKLEQQGKWEAVSRTVVPRYSFTNDGVVFVFKVKASLP